VSGYPAAELVPDRAPGSRAVTGRDARPHHCTSCGTDRAAGVQCPPRTRPYLAIRPCSRRRAPRSLPVAGLSARPNMGLARGACECRLELQDRSVGRELHAVSRRRRGRTRLRERHGLEVIPCLVSQRYVAQALPCIGQTFSEPRRPGFWVDAANSR
jgi:hypothetical protein